MVNTLALTSFVSCAPSVIVMTASKGLAAQNPASTAACKHCGVQAQLPSMTIC
jgi:hypothetical protein